MNNSKLTTLLQSFSPKEWKHFRSWLDSPYLNNIPELCAIAKWLQQHIQAPTLPARAHMAEALFPGNPPDDKQLNYYLSWLYQAALQFLYMEHNQAAPAAMETEIAGILSNRGLDKHYGFQVARARRIMEQSPNRDAQYWQQSFNILNIEAEHFARKGERKANPFQQNASNDLDKFYFSEKLRYACSMLQSQVIVATEFNINFVAEIAIYLESHPEWLEEPSIAIYYHIWKLLIDPASGDHHYQALKQLIRAHSIRFSAEERTAHYIYALNYCIGQIRNVKEIYVAEALQLYEEGIDSTALLNDGKLSPWHYKNIIRLGLRSKAFEWTELFIRSKNALLDKSYQSNALHFGLADLYFYTKRYPLAQEHLNQADLTDIYNNLDAREMLAKIYYETDEDDALFSHIHAFRTYLRRNKLISDQVRKAYLNFLKLLEQSIRTSGDQMKTLKEVIEQTEPLVAKSWLLEKVN